MRVDSFTNKLIKEGFVIGDNYYTDSEEKALELVKEEGYNSLEESYSNGFHYWTSWEELEEDDLLEDFEICGGDGISYELWEHKQTKEIIRVNINITRDLINIEL